MKRLKVKFRKWEHLLWQLRQIRASQAVYQHSHTKVQQDLKLLEQACDQLKASQSFMKILEMVLAVGNHLNGGSFRGAARGFKLGALLKLMDVKSCNRKTTLLHFVVAELLRTDQKVGKLGEELKLVKSAANLSLERMKFGLRELEVGVELIKSEVAHSQGLAAKENLDEKQQLLLLMPFHEKSESEVNLLRGLYDTTLTKLKDLAVYFGETLKEDRLIELFRTTREFLFMFDQVSSELKEAKRREDATASKRAQPFTCSSFSCPVSPAKGSHSAVALTKECPTVFNLVPHEDGQAKQVDLGVSSLLKKTQSFPFFRTEQLQLPDNGKEKEDLGLLPTLQNSTSCLREIPRSNVVTNPLWNDNMADRPDPFSTQSACYDSDWSTG